MVKHEKQAFLKFFLTYFFSVALLILSSGFFYFQQMKSQLIKEEHFSLIEYARHIKMGRDLDEFSRDFHYKMSTQEKHIDISNFTEAKNEFSKLIPTRLEKEYLQVFKSKKSYLNKLTKLKEIIISIQILLLFIFALLSYFLAKNALKPLNESIKTLDKFAKDLIHDLNTPVTAMKLNIKILEKNENLQNIKAFSRLKKSIESISELRKSLTTLLEHKTFQITTLNVCDTIKDIMELHQPNYPNLEFKIECSSLEIKANENALKQILHNLISNACKYNSKNGYIKIYTKNKTLFIEDNGTPIDDIDKIFNREFSTKNSTGFGLDIVKRLCSAMNIKIKVISDTSGNCFSLSFN